MSLNLTSIPLSHTSQTPTILPFSSSPPASSNPPQSTVIQTSSPPQSAAPPVTSAPAPHISVVTAIITNESPVVTVITSTSPSPSYSTSSTSSAASSSTGTNFLGLQGQNNTAASPGLSQAGKTAIEVTVPIVAVALIVLALVFFWRKRSQRKTARELRKKEVEEYGYNPNDDPTLPAVGVKASGDGPFQMQEDGGYRGWGAKTVGSSARKASTAVSGGQSGMAHSGGQSPTHGPVSDSRSGDTLIGSPTGRPTSDGSEILGAMGPATTANRAGDMHRGPSNASSSYSAANRSDGSGDQPMSGGPYGQAQYYSSEGGYGGPYADTYGGQTGGRAEMGGQPVIRDNLARRATRIENPSHFPTQASAGISQNF